MCPAPRHTRYLLGFLMVLAHTPAELAAALQPHWRAGTPLGFVPTMGALHPGHLSLVEAARQHCPVVVASVFVNPAQFGPNEDFGTYPRRLAADAGLLHAAGVQVVFAPEPAAIYPPGAQLTIQLPTLGADAEGQFRPGFFNGVALVVTKLLNLVRPTHAFFGLKDFQQYHVIRRLVQELFLPVQVVGCPTLREPDGLAMSSRNEYLTPAQRQQALLLHRILTGAQQLAAQGGLQPAELEAWALQQFAAHPEWAPDYALLRRAADFGPVQALTPQQEPVLLLAARLGTTRLIDNMQLLG